MKTFMKSGGWRTRLNPNSKKDRDEDLVLFRELHKREQDRIASLLHPVSDEFEASGNEENNALYKISSGTEGEKNDFNWLKTPPATPLFQSLEMEATGLQPVPHHELPILQPLSRFARNTELPKEKIEVPKIPKSKPKIPSRSVTPSNRRSTETQKLTQKSNNLRTPNLSDQKLTQSDDLWANPRSRGVSPPVRSTIHAQDSKARPRSRGVSPSPSVRSTIPAQDSKVKPRSRGVSPSPSVRSTIPVQFPEFSSKTPANLKIDRSTSVTRGRQVANPVVAVNKKPESNTPVSRRIANSCSPSVTRGRRMEPKNPEIRGNGSQEIRGNGSPFLGSKMVDKIMSARKTNVEGRGGQLSSPRGSIDGNKGFGRRMTTAKNSLETAFK